MSPRHLFLHFVGLYLNLFETNRSPLRLTLYLEQARAIPEEVLLPDPEQCAHQFVLWRIGYQRQPDWLPH
jgi:hypothetical protein